MAKVKVYCPLVGDDVPISWCYTCEYGIPSDNGDLGDNLRCHYQADGGEESGAPRRGTTEEAA